MPGTTLDDIFPPVQRVFYRHSPLVQVVCELRFPALLKIESELPAAFQERVREQFPLFKQTNQAPIGDIPKELEQLLQLHEGRVHYQFLTEDESWSLGLRRGAMTLQTTSYGQWETFRSFFDVAHSALVECYGPKFLSRIGLRYIDRIIRSDLGLENVLWCELIRPSVLGELHSQAIEARAIEAHGILRVRLPDHDDRALLQHRLEARTKDDGQSFIIDFDFYNESKINTADATRTLDRLRSGAGRAFRWCITDRLHKALGPQPIAVARAS